ncbi:thiolase [Sphingobium sp. TA15]|uniref:Acetyl-CoA C-acetyltransferase n=1 Tax=Sphingobium indicum (strain DSM 16413 / CCM 7287 / MTCC 6362 / UT26 / NBRC 101211 / UT26S) TaxID=452662 RepID=D4Z0W1_SPHIU|nr:acetyl-CoA C-acyltransferase family protein [Sphingobium indicum]BAI96243.1 acetyl-CoA C-acetyltransferase [Sphingobium indicum UT26S]BDD65544.1 thiolase [Sphingobium sp. TA15]
MNEVFLVSAARAPIGSFGGSLKDFTPGDIGALVAKAAIARAGIEADLVANVVFGSVIPTIPGDAYVARIAAMGAGIPKEAPALTVNRLCGSGMQAIVSAAQSILLGDYGIGLAGGTEIMSRAPYFAQGVRWGQKMGDTAMLDGLTGALTDPFHAYHMGMTAENVAQEYGISRQDQDELALESQRRAAHAIAQGRFVDQIVPVDITIKRKAVTFDTDEYVRVDATAEDFAGLRPVFKKDGGTVTAGNASGINDGAAAMILASGQAVKDHGLTPLARLVSYGHAGVDPAFMGVGPVPATRNALAKAGLSVSDLDVIESNEAFAAQACAVTRALSLDPAKVNPNGSGISLGHPIGATGAIIVTKLAYELQRTGGRFGLATMCIGGGQGISTIWERT